MCGIVGVVTNNGSVSLDRLARATEAMAHRGPDDSGLQLIRVPSPFPVEIGLGCRRLAILDLSADGHQPMLDPETGNWIVYNGELYNFRQIRAKLESMGVPFNSKSDTEVVLKAYGKWGQKCLAEFRGMFALAIWDAHRQRLFLARDRMGIKPLYYYRKDSQLIFASEVRALLASGMVQPRLNPGALIHYLSFGSVGDSAPLIEGVRAVRPGHYLIWERGRIESVEYWDIGGQEPPGYSSAKVTRDPQLDAEKREEIRKKLREILEETVHLRLVGDVPVGVFLSGGIDSSSIVALLSQDNNSRVNTFSVVFKESDYSEAKFSRSMARRVNADHHEIVLSQCDAMKAIPNAIRAMDQPTVDGINSYVISREVRRRGFKVALSGLGGDEIFAGYKTFKTVPRMERFAKAMGHFPIGIRKGIANLFTSVFPASDQASKLSAIIEGRFGIDDLYTLARMLFLPDQQHSLLKLLDPVVYQEAHRWGIATLQRASGFDPINRVSYLELRTYLLNTLLRDTDVMSMAHGLEVRVPFLDHKLVEYLFSLPGPAKLDGRIPKHLLVGAMGNLLPDDVVNRPKQGFTLPFEHWLSGELRGEVEDVLCGLQDNPLDEFLYPESVRKVWHAFLKRRTSWSRPWALYVLKKWCALHF